MRLYLRDGTNSEGVVRRCEKLKEEGWISIWGHPLCLWTGVLMERIVWMPHPCLTPLSATAALIRQLNLSSFGNRSHHTEEELIRPGTIKRHWECPKAWTVQCLVFPSFFLLNCEMYCSEHCAALSQYHRLFSLNRLHQYFIKPSFACGTLLFNSPLVTEQNVNCMRPGVW